MENKIKDSQKEISVATEVDITKLDERVIQLVSEIDAAIFSKKPAGIEYTEGRDFKKTINTLCEIDKELDEKELIGDLLLDYIRDWRLRIKIVSKDIQELLDHGAIWAIYNKDTGKYELWKFTLKSGITGIVKSYRYIFVESNSQFTPEEACVALAAEIVRRRVRLEKKVIQFKQGDDKKAVNLELKAIISCVSKKHFKENKPAPWCKGKLCFDSQVIMYLSAYLWHRGVRDISVIAGIVKEDARNLFKRELLLPSFIICKNHPTLANM